MGRFLTHGQLKRLDAHKYSASNQSILDPPLQKWWTFVVGLVPLWVAPNLITMVGLVVNVATSVVLMALCPTATEPAPMWPSLACAIGLFVYQTLDAIDGKQARRTNTQSPLGELFDHGCDSLSTVFVTLATACTVSLGHTPNFLLLQCFTASVLFYCAQWQAYVTGTMRFGKVDVTEAQVCVMSVMAANALFGSTLWDRELLGLELRCGPTIFGCVVCSWSLLQTLQIISNGGAGKNGSTIAVTVTMSSTLTVNLSSTSTDTTVSVTLRTLVFAVACLGFLSHLASCYYAVFIHPGGCGKNGSTSAVRIKMRHG